MAFDIVAVAVTAVPPVTLLEDKVTPVRVAGGTSGILQMPRPKVAAYMYPAPVVISNTCVFGKPYALERFCQVAPPSMVS